MDLSAGDCCASSLLRPMKVFDRITERGGSDLSQAFGHFSRRPARNIGLVRAGVVEDLPARQVPRREQRAGLAHRRREREVARGETPTE